MNDEWRRIDPDTLHEDTCEPDATRAGLGELQAGVRGAQDTTDELYNRGELVTWLRRLGDLDAALTEAHRAADRAEIDGTAAQQHVARMHLAQVHQYRGEFAEANLLLTELLAAAPGFGPIVEGFTAFAAGSNDVDQQHWDDAAARFARSLELLGPFEVPEAADAQLGLAVVARRRGSGA